MNNIIDKILERNNNIFGISTDEYIEKASLRISNKYKNIAKYTLWIRNNEGQNMPHFHVNINSQIRCYICLDIPIYFDHGDGVLNPLSSKESKQLYEFMKSPYARNSNITNYEYLCNQWNIINSPFQFPNVAPDYSKLDSNITSKTVDVDEYRKSNKK